MGRPLLLMHGLWSMLAVCLLVKSCLTVVNCVKLSEFASNKDRHDILQRSRRDEECDGSRCLNGGTCTQLIFWEYCTCPDTHIGDHCEMENPCNYSPCKNGGLCLPGDVLDLGRDSTVCLCLEGWSGPNCETVSTSSCTTDTCRNGGTCFTFEGFPLCDCAPGFTGVDCEHVAPCSTTQCPESHACVNIWGVDHCVCIHGLTGPDCVIETDANNNCENNDPCRNGGSCDDTIEPGFMVCRCPLGYDGLYCEKAITSSLPCNDLHTPCANGGTCQLYGSNYFCHCTTEYFGANCTESILYQLCLDYCENGGSCYIDESAPHCSCTPSWEGRQCSVPKHHTTTIASVITSLPCLNYCANGGTCSIGAYGPRCTCTPSWEGSQCSVLKHQTTTKAPVITSLLCRNYCRNGGTCSFGAYGPSCTCTLSWEGTHCSVRRFLTTTKTAEPDCTLQCGDYGECQLGTNGDRYCRCYSGWNGDKCQNKEVISPDTPASGSSIGAVLGGATGGAFLLLIIFLVIVLMISLTRKRNCRRQHAHSQAVGYSNDVVYDPRFGIENGSFVHAQATPNPTSLPAKDLYGSGKASGSNMPRRYAKNAAQNNYTAKEPNVVRNPASAYQYAYGAPPPARKTSRSSVPPESHEYAYASGDYQPYHPPTASGPPPPYSGVRSSGASAAPSIAASAEHTYQSLSEFGDTGRSNKH